MFEFKNFDFLTDNDIDLVIEHKISAENIKNFLPTYFYSIFLHDSHREIGKINFTIGDNENIKYEGNIGIKLEEEYMVKGYGVRACKLISTVAIVHKMYEVIITCKPENYISRKSYEKLGAKLLGILTIPEESELYKNGQKQSCVYKWHLKDNENCFEDVKLVYSKLSI